MLHLINNRVVIEKLLADRIVAREEKNWVQADAIRDILNTYGIQVVDTKEGQLPRNYNTVLKQRYRTDIEKLQCTISWQASEITRLKDESNFLVRLYEKRIKFYLDRYITKPIIMPNQVSSL